MLHSLFQLSPAVLQIQTEEEPASSNLCELDEVPEGKKQHRHAASFTATEDRLSIEPVPVVAN